MSEPSDAERAAQDARDRVFAAWNRSAEAADRREANYKQRIADLERQLVDEKQRSEALEQRLEHAWEAQYCCDGSDCACQGKPVNPWPGWLEMSQEIRDEKQRADRLERECAELRDKLDRMRCIRVELAEGVQEEFDRGE